MSPDLGRFYPEVSEIDNEEDVKDRLEVNPVDIEPENVYLFARVFEGILKSETGTVSITFPDLHNEVSSEGLDEIAHTLRDGFEKTGIHLNIITIPGDGWHENPEILISLKR